MNPTEKAEVALNTRLDRLQANLRETSSDTARRFLFQSLVVCVGLGEALTDYVKQIGEYAQARYSQLKQTQTTLTAEHAALLASGNDLLERLKANPSDRSIRQEIAHSATWQRSKKLCVVEPTRCSAISRRVWRWSTNWR